MPVKRPEKIIPQLIIMSLVLAIFSNSLSPFRTFTSLIAEPNETLISSLLGTGSGHIPFAFAENAHDLKNKAEKKEDKADELEGENKEDKADELKDEAKKLKHKAEKAKAEEKEERKQQEEKDKTKEQKEKTNKKDEKQQKLESIQTCTITQHNQSKIDGCDLYYGKVCSEPKNSNGVLGSDFSYCSVEEKKKLQETTVTANTPSELNQTLDENEIKTNKSLDNYLKQNKTDNPFECNPTEMSIVKGNTASMSCAIQNNSPKSIKMKLECSGFAIGEIACIINKSSSKAEAILIREHSEVNFTVDIVSKSSTPLGSYSFNINALCYECMETKKSN